MDAEDGGERAEENPLLPSYSPRLGAYSELSWQTKISLFLYNTCSSPPTPRSSSELRKQNEHMRIETWTASIKTRLSWRPEKKKQEWKREGCTRTAGCCRYFI